MFNCDLDGSFEFIIFSALYSGWLLFVITAITNYGVKNMGIFLQIHQEENVLMDILMVFY